MTSEKEMEMAKEAIREHSKRVKKLDEWAEVLANIIVLFGFLGVLAFIVA